MTFPNDDAQFKDQTITNVEENENGTFTIVVDGWHLWAGAESKDHKPKAGQVARLYGRGIGHAVRGLFIDGHRMWYRTEAEDGEYQEILLYGADATEWLRRWDEGKSVWTIEMGGLGPGYEQVIHITAAEILRWFLANNPALYTSDGKWDKSVEDKLDKAVSPIIAALGLSGAQWGAALNIATMLYRKGPRAVMADEQVKDRHIQVQRIFPALQVEAAR